MERGREREGGGGRDWYDTTTRNWQTIGAENSCVCDMSDCTIISPAMSLFNFRIQEQRSPIFSCLQP